MRALANKFGAQLSFRQRQINGTIDLTKQDDAELVPTWADSTLNAARTVANFNRAYWRMLLRMYGWGRAA